MKKTNVKKLQLRKDVVANLGKSRMDRLIGGAPDLSTHCSKLCPTGDYTNSYCSIGCETSICA